MKTIRYIIRRILGVYSPSRAVLDAMGGKDTWDSRMLKEDQPDVWNSAVRLGSFMKEIQEGIRRAQQEMNKFNEAVNENGDVWSGDDCT